MKAYTLIELMISVLLLGVVLLGGTSIFYQNLKVSGLSDVDANLGSTLQAVLRTIEKDIRYSGITAVGLGTRDDCLLAGDNGYSGSSLSATDLAGLETIYDLQEDKVASTSSQTGQTVYLSPSQLKIITLQFVWYCTGNISDKMKITIGAESTALSTGIKVERNVSTEVNLLNSGLN